MDDHKINSVEIPEKMADASRRLATSIARWTGDENQADAKVPGLRFSRWTTPTEPTSYTLESSICLIAQGSKRVLLGEDAYVYDATRFLITSVDLPVVANIIEASTEKPYLGLVLEIDLKEISQLTVDSGLPVSRSGQAQKGMAVGRLSLPLLETFQRLIDLLDEEENIKILAPLIKREIFFRLLTSDQGPRLQQIAASGSHSHQISRAITWLKNNYTRPLSVNELAASAGMSRSAFHSHFKVMTSMTPLQFQKRLRLNEARRLMLTENLDAMTATFEVGYESASQFSREYSRLFGAPPLRDINRLRDTAST
ncbi:AraC family transcriptional regulator [Desulfobacter hydrogenophilus]|jgi:AraC-like DNA-binding protein|uniref:AraC family transcriptional regulator n=1 Tax=Desulfobacter hydrogenophilus TaxID=2291 RepID=A0A328FGS8_9BACT|nr:AraC family transcriptional regulator [Desulfobacter hydrogenophilus]NDY73168.1 AraC family transcriptional regulator [Desulfobacter hydrogenophilus]QBH14755.1 AraC family transcriptional regulator [Desulfobacter hydrogenophilus]RAM03788.1 AraC family transcriptional regulator [Desulfobacter hydrogenophilus]